MRSRALPQTQDEKLRPVTGAGVGRLFRLAWPHRWALGLGGLLLLISSAVNLSMPLVARGELNRLLESATPTALDRLVLALVALIVISGGFAFVQHVIVARAGHRIVTDLRRDLFGHLQRLPVAYFDRRRSGDIASHLSNDVSLVQQTLTSDIVSLLSNVVTLFGGIAIALYLDWRLTLVVVGLLGLVMAFFVVFGRKLRKLTRAALDALSDAMGAMTEAMANIRVVKAFAREAHEDERAGHKLEKVYGLQVKTAVWEGAMGAVAFVGFVLLLLGVIWYGGRKVIAGELDAGSLLAFFMTVTIISGPMGSLAALYTRLQRATGAAERLFEILDERAEEADSVEAESMPAGDGEVEFDDVQFRYSEGREVLLGLSLRVPAGRRTALVGPSGGGKSTLAALLYRFYEPQSGEIRVDGVAIRRLRRESLREHLALVPQDPALFDGSLYENIAYGQAGASREQVLAAARAANVHEFAERLPEGYETLIGERGVTLSGGQRQRVAIARALLKDPRILVLDEATSALDTQSEALVREALEHLTAGRTTLIIAHRLSTVESADLIAVLDEGRIVEQGTHAELLARSGRYAELHGVLPLA